MRSLRRRLNLAHDGRTFLDRWGLVHERLGGFYLHHIAAADPGLDVHDHPWWFATIVLRGGYTEHYFPDARRAHGETIRHWLRFSVHTMPLTVAHRIIDAEPNTWTLVLRGPTRRDWGFYVRDIGWIPWGVYDYENRRPSVERQR